MGLKQTRAKLVVHELKPLFAAETFQEVGENDLLPGNHTRR